MKNTILSVLALGQLFAFSFSRHADAAVAASGLIGQWKFDEGKGTTTSDSSGKGHTGTLVNGPAWTAGKLGTALKFADSSYVEINDFNPPSSLTLEAWINPADNTGTDSIIISKGNTEYDLRINGNGSLSGLAGGTSIADTSFNSYSNANQWSHVVFTFDGPTKAAKLYRNGVLAASLTGTGAGIANLATQLRIGRHTQWEFGTFLGIIDNVRLYSRALTGSEVLANYQEGAPSDTQPPTVSITSPANKTTVNGTINVNATASDNVGVAGVQFKLNGSNLGAELSSPPYSVSLNTTTLSNGGYVLTAVARDAASNTATSTPVNITVFNPPPPTAITSFKANPSTIALGQSSTLSWTTTNAASASISPSVGSVAVNGSAIVSPAVTTSYVLTAAGPGVSVTATAVVTVSGDMIPPTISITSPADGADVAGTIVVTTAASDNIGVTRAELYVDAILKAATTVPPFSFSLDSATLTNASHSLTAKAYDAAGNSTTSVAVSITPVNPPGTTSTCNSVSGSPAWNYCITRTNGSASTDLLYVMHALGGDEFSWNSLYQNIRDSWTASGTQAPIVVTATFASNEWLIDPNASGNSGWLQVYANTVMPAMERAVGFNPAVSKRKLFGESMGGFNASQLLLKYGSRFSRAALADPAILSIPPYPTDTELNDYVTRTNADIGAVNYILSNIQAFFPDNSSWPNNDPLALSLSLLSASSPPLYVSGDSADTFGFEVGDQQFATNAQSRRETATWELVIGPHFTKNATAIANFLALP